jgi:excisionase family DNA binding protein
MSQPQEKMLTVKQVADRMTVDERTVRGWIQKGELKAVNVGGTLRREYRIRPDDLEDFIRSREIDKNS